MFFTYVFLHKAKVNVLAKSHPYIFFTLPYTSSLPCLHTFWHAIPTSFYYLLVLDYSPTIGIWQWHPNSPVLSQTTAINTAASKISLRILGGVVLRVAVKYKILLATLHNQDQYQLQDFNFCMDSWKKCWRCRGPCNSWSYKHGLLD